MPMSPMNLSRPNVYPYETPSADGRYCKTCAHRFTYVDNPTSDNWECRRPSTPVNFVTGEKKYTTCVFERSMAGACGNGGKYYSPIK